MESPRQDPIPPQPTPQPQPRLTICPYCGGKSRSLAACESCGGRFDPLSRQATQNAMGPWYVRVESQPFRPGCSYSTMLGLIERGAIKPDTAIRGPTTKQFWMLARWCPGVAHRLGLCHSCQARVAPESENCPTCGAGFDAPTERQMLGLGEVRTLPGKPSGSTEAVVVDGVSSRDESAPVPVAMETKPAAHTATEQSEEVDPESLRELRLRRDLRKARRWGRLWASVAAIGLLAAAGYVVYGELDLGAGPAGRWLGSGEGADADVAGDDGAVPDSPEVSEAVGGVDTTPSQQTADAGEDRGQGVAEVDEVELPKPETDTAADEPPLSPRLERLGQLRGLR